MIRYIKLSFIICILSLCLIGCSNKENIEEQKVEDTSIIEEETFIDGVHDITIDEDTDPQDMFNKLIEGVSYSGYSLNVSNVNILNPGEYEAYWEDNNGNRVVCKVIVNDVEEITTEVVEETSEEEITTEEISETPIQTPQETTPPTQPTTETNTQPKEEPIVEETPTTTEQEIPQGNTINGVHNVTKSWADTSWNTQSVLMELYSGVSCTGNDTATLKYTSEQPTGPGTYTYTWYWSDGSVAATCYLYVTE